MGNIIVSDDIIAVTDAMLSVKSELTGYNDENMLVLTSLERAFRANNATANDWLWKVNFGAAQVVAAVVLSDVNFDKVIIEGHASDVWTAPSFTSGSVTISKNAMTNRYSVYVPLTAFNYQFLRAYIPADASAVGRYTTKWHIGSMCCLSAATAFSTNMAAPYTRRAPIPYSDIQLDNGCTRRVKLGNLKRLEVDISFGSARTTTGEGELWTMDATDIGLPVVFYENLSDTSMVMIGMRDGNYEGTQIFNGITVGNVIRFKELV